MSVKSHGLHRTAIRLYIATSLDGYIATASGSVDWLFTDNDYGYEAFYAQIGTVLMGRKTYEQVLTCGEYPYPEAESLVFSRSPRAHTDERVRFVSAEDMAAIVTALRQREGKDAWLVGGGELTRVFLGNDWIDEIVLSIHPVLLGAGLPLFLPHVSEDGARPLWWQLQQTQSYPSGLVQLTYCRAC